MSVRVSALVVVLAVLSPAIRAEEPKKETNPKPPTYKVPKGWEAVEDKKPGGIAATRFRAGEGDKAVAMILLGSSGTGGGVTANVNRWRAQLGLKELDEKGVEKAVETIKVDGRDAYRMDATGPEVAGKVKQRIVAVIVSRDNETWFVRMSGPAEQVGEQKKAFDAFVQSLRFEK